MRNWPDNEVSDLPWWEDLCNHIRDDLGMTETSYAREVAHELWNER